MFFRTLDPLQFERLCTKMRKAHEKKEKKEKLKQRSSLVLGVNEVTKALEKGTLKLVLVRIIDVIDLVQGFYWVNIGQVKYFFIKFYLF